MDFYVEFNFDFFDDTYTDYGSTQDMKDGHKVFEGEGGLLKNFYKII